MVFFFAAIAAWFFPLPPPLELDLAAEELLAAGGDDFGVDDEVFAEPELSFNE